MIAELIRTVRQMLTKDTPRPVVEEIDEQEKAQLKKRLSEAEARLRRLEWEADVLRRPATQERRDDPS